MCRCKQQLFIGKASRVSTLRSCSIYAPSKLLCRLLELACCTLNEEKSDAHGWSSSQHGSPKALAFHWQALLADHYQTCWSSAGQRHHDNEEMLDVPNVMSFWETLPGPTASIMLSVCLHH